MNSLLMVSVFAPNLPPVQLQPPPDPRLWLVGLGCCCLGILIGALVAIFVVETERFNFAALSGVISILCGAGVIAIFHTLGGRQYVPEYWFYPVGLLGGATILALLKGKI